MSPSRALRMIRATALPGTLVVLVMAGSPASLAQVTGSLEIAWNANSEPDLAGYRIYVDDDPNTFNLPPATARPLAFRTIDVGVNVTGQIVNNLDAGRVWFFAVTARDLSGNESAFSSVINRQPSSTPTVRTVSPNSATQGDLNRPVTITGTNFLAGSIVSFGSGVTVTGLNTSGIPVTLVATINVGGIAQVKSYDVSVANPGGSTGVRNSAFSVAFNECRLDSDASGRIDGADFVNMLLGFPSIVGDAYYSTTRDLDVDGQVDGADMSLFFTFFGSSVTCP